MSCVSENLGYRKGLDKKGEYQDFPSKFICLTVPKNFVGEPFWCFTKFGYRRSLWIRGGGGEGVSRFSVENFLSHGAAKFRRGTL